METNLSPDNSTLSEVPNPDTDIIEKVLKEVGKDKKFNKEIATEHDLDWNGKLMLRIVTKAIQKALSFKDNQHRASIQEAQKRCLEEIRGLNGELAMRLIINKIFSEEFGDFSDNNVGVVSEGSCDINSEKGLHKAGSNPAPDTKIQNICECGHDKVRHYKIMNEPEIYGCANIVGEKKCPCKKFTPKKGLGE